MLAKADMYSYGVVLWELCTLQKPFAGMSSHEHARKVRHSLFVAGATAVSQPFCREEVFKLLLSRLPSFAWLFAHPTPTKHAREYHSRTKMPLRPPGSCVTYSATDCRLAFPPSLRHFFLLATHKSTPFAELLENISTPGISAWDAASTGLEMATGPEGLDGVVLARGAGSAAGRGAGRQDTFPSDTKDRRQLGLVVAIVLHLVIATVFRQRIDDKDGHAPIAAG